MIDRRAPWIAALVALVAALATMTSDPIGGFNDDGLYLLMAKALAGGQGFVYPHLPGLPPAIHYPPVWPLILAAAWKVGPEFPGNLAWFKLINPIVLAAAAAGAVVLGRRLLGLSSWVALGAVVAATITVPVLLLTNLLLSEPLFLALLPPTLLVGERLVRDGGARRAIAGAALVALLVLVRTLGGVVIVAEALLLARARRWRELAIYLGVATLLLLPWQLYVWRATPGFPVELKGSYGPYLEWVADGYRSGGLSFLGAVVAKNLADTWTMIGVFTSPLVGGTTRHGMAALATLIFAVGLVVAARRDRAPVTALAIAGYLGVVIAWPFWVDRFLWVIWPLVVLLSVAGVVTLAEEWRARGRTRAARTAFALLAIVVVGHTVYNARGLARGWATSASRNQTGAGILLARQVNQDRSLDGKLLAAELAPMLAIYTGERVLPVEILAPRDHVVEKTAAEHVDELERIDRRFRPEAYLVMHAGPFYPALLAAHLDSGRVLIDVSPRGAPARTLKVQR